MRTIFIKVLTATQI